MVKIAVLGAGINGVASAVKIKEKYREFEVVIISKEFTPDTTGDGSGGLWNPFICGETPPELITKWGLETYNYLHQLWLEGGYDICAYPIYELYREVPGLPRQPWADGVFGYRDLDAAQISYLSRLYSTKYAVGHTFTTFQVLPSTIIGYLFSRFLALGGRPMTHTVRSLTDPTLDGYDVIVNCTGLGARSIVPDEKVYPVRGQIFRVNAPWQNVCVIDETTCHYIIPNVKSCVLGGTHQDNDYNTEVDENDTNHILSGCNNMIPSMQHAPIVSSWVGLRPARRSVRLEPEWGGGRTPLYIHNYGHGGSGLTLFWGCSSEVLDILQELLKNTTIKAKL